MSFGDFKEKCIKGLKLKKIGLDRSNSAEAYKKEINREETPSALTPIQEIKFPPQVVIFVFQKDPGWFGQVVLNGNKIGVFISSPPEPCKIIRDC